MATVLFLSTVSRPGPAESTELLVADAPIIVEAAPGVDIDDPELITLIEDAHSEFDGGADVGLGNGPDAGFLHASQSSGMSVAFDQTYTAPSNVQTVVLAAAGDWDGALATTPSAPVEIAVIWRNLGSSNLLGSAGPNGLYAGQALPTGSFYPAGLANTLLGYDINGSGSAELTINLNSQVNWYTGTSGTPSAGQVDLYSVVLHEIAHGLGFIGSASLNNDLPNTQPTLESPTFVYDNDVLYAGQQLVGLPSANSHLTSNNLQIHISDTIAKPVYAPANWQEGSSFSHFDESSHPSGTPGALMTPVLSSTETERTLDAATLGVMARMGWPMRVTAATPTITAAQVNSGVLTVNWAENLNQTRLAPDTYRAEAWLGGQLIGSASVSGQGTWAQIGGLNSGGSYTIRVVPVTDQVDGTAAATTVSTPLVPNAPKAVKATGVGSAQTVSWIVDGGPTADSYHLERSTDEGPWTALGSVSGTSLTVTVPEGVTQFRVRGSNTHGFGSYGVSIPTGIGGANGVRPVALDSQISRLYVAYFGREPDADGFAFWRTTRATGVALADVSEAFQASSEFQATYGSVDNGSFVDLVYQNVLSRSPDAEGRAYWVSQLNAGTPRGQVMVGFSESTEFIGETGTVQPQSSSEAEVYRLYVAFFLRPPDQSGFDYWVSVRAGGASLSEIAAAFASSSEFQASYGSLNDADFVELVYHNVLARNPDGTGVEYWQGLLASGVSRGEMMIGFSNSLEFVLATGSLPN
ncbi:MAG: DUF4214 domain-containing protein [Actinomycetota bacterium]